MGFLGVDNMSIIKVLYITWIIVIIFMFCIYDEGVYDCSNMCADQTYIFEKLGLDVCYAVDYEEKHAYLYISNLHMYWEATVLFPRTKTEHCMIFENEEDIFEYNPNHDKHDFDNSKVISYVKRRLDD